jgi:hypothetical protein
MTDCTRKNAAENFTQLLLLVLLSMCQKANFKEFRQCAVQKLEALGSHCLKKNERKSILIN